MGVEGNNARRPLVRTSQSEDQSQAAIYATHSLRGQRPNPFRKIRTINSHKLRYVYHGRFRETGFAARNANIPRCFAQREIGRDGGDDYGRYSTVVKGVGLNKQYGAPKAGTRAGGVRKGGPPDFTTFHGPTSQIGHTSMRDLLRTVRCNTPRSVSP